MTVKAAEDIALAVAENRKEASDDCEVLERLDARIERELYPESPLRTLVRKGVAFHHAQLPPRVRISLEDVIKNRKVNVVCATTTLAEGVNFPFSTVVVESLVSRNHHLTPRALWNIAGRAGRFGVDSEGHCIIFDPKSFESKLTPYKLSDYLRTKLDDIPPVRSALGMAISQLEGAVRTGGLPMEALSEIHLGGLAIDGKPKSLRSKQLRGLVNIVRVGYAHASSSKLISLDDGIASELTSGVLASRQMSEETRTFANSFGLQQRSVIRSAFSESTDLMEIAARIGWSLETQATIYDWLRSLDNWQLDNFGKIVLGGHLISSAKLGYLLGPVAKHMGELDGETLGGFTAYVARGWIEGLPLTAIRESQREKDLGKLVKVIYARIQYLLPWALYGVSELLAFEGKIRGIAVQDGVHDLSVLAAEGVPNFDALQLVMSLGIERVDATRLSRAYIQQPHRETDIIGFFRGLGWPAIAGIVRGSDRRRLDPDLRIIWEQLRESGVN